MKSFNYTARDTKGATKIGNIQAVDRAGAIIEVKARGMVPLSITETRDGAQASAPRWLSAMNPKTLMVAIAALIAIGIALMTLLPRESKNQSAPQKKARPKNVPIRAHIKSPLESPTTTNSVDAKPTADTNKVTLIAVSSPDSPNITPSLDTTNTITNRIRPQFASMTERNISMLINTPLGSMPPPILAKFPTNENLMAILDRDIMVYDEDDDKMLKRKQNVAEAKQILKNLMAQGGGSTEFINYFRKQLSDAHKERKTHQDVITQLYRAGEYEAALKYAEEKNPELQAKSIMPLHVPVSNQPQQETQ